MSDDNNGLCLMTTMDDHDDDDGKKDYAEKEYGCDGRSSPDRYI